MKKILNDLKLRFENPNWALDPELALIDTVLEQHPELFERENICRSAVSVVKIVSL